MQICLVGGTYDPPHWGHVLLAESVRAAFSISEIVFIPASVPPHKQAETISSADHRIRMLQLICEKNPGFSVDPREINRGGVSYTIDTVREIRRERLLTSNEIGVLIGADNFVDLKHWKQADELVQECRVLVMPRPNVTVGPDTPYQTDVKFIETPLIDISSSEIRERVRDKLSIRYYVLPAVEKHIFENDLYTDSVQQ